MGCHNFLVAPQEVTVKALCGLFLVPLVAVAQPKAKHVSDNGYEATVIEDGSTMWVVANNDDSSVDRMSQMLGQSREVTARGLTAVYCGFGEKGPKRFKTFKLVGAYEGDKVVVLTGSRKQMKQLCHTRGGPDLANLTEQLGTFISKAELPKADVQ
jgi:hypothetical protein